MLIRASLLSERFSKREPAAIRIFSLACCLDHHDASATQLTDKIPRVRPRKHDDQVDSPAQFLDWFKRPFPNQGMLQPACLRQKQPEPSADGSKARSNKLAADSPLEGDGFEPSVPLGET